MSVKFKFSADKAAAAIGKLAREHPGVDLHAALKAFYFADKSHLNAERRPIFGARYRAMKFGPVPLEIYEMIKGESYWLAELGWDDYPWALRGRNLDSRNKRGMSQDVLSESDLEHFQRGMERSLPMTFSARTAATHGPDWKAADMGIMRYEDMVEDGPEKPAIIDYLAEYGRHVRL